MSILWTPTPEQAEKTAVYQLMQSVGVLDYQSLWQWSIDQPEDFWSTVWDACDVIGEKGKTILRRADTMRESRFFPEARLNYAENLLERGQDDDEAIIFWGEDKLKLRLNRRELKAQVAQLAQVLRDAGVMKGDRVAGLVPNMPIAVIGWLAAASIGAVWSSASPDFGVEGVLDRFGQIEPKILITVDGYYYNGKTIDIGDKWAAIQNRLPSLVHTIVFPYLDHGASSYPYTRWADILDKPPVPLTYELMAFDDPLVIMFSSGTTGKPKCIVHGVGGTLLQHMKEHRYQCDIRAGDRVFYFTTCGWMMWNWQVTALAAGATLLLYDGSPFAPKKDILFDYADAEGMTLFGTAAKYIDALNKHGVRPKDTHDLSTIRTMTSTGSPLVHESFDFVYTHIKSDMHLASISGGTDIISCFVIGNPAGPVHRGEIQAAGLGLAMDAYTPDGKPAGIGEKGELVCTKPFPCMPVSFFNDADGQRYHKAYFDRFDNIWCHGDWVEKTESSGWIIHGRSDATLNPGGVRIGTAEIYRQVEQIAEVMESIAVGQDWDGDVRVVLFVVLKEGAALDQGLKDRIRAQIRAGASPRHVPEVIVQVADIPRTKSGKITEIAVRDVIHGRAIGNKEALANPEALDHFANRPELAA